MTKQPELYHRMTDEDDVIGTEYFIKAISFVVCIIGVFAFLLCAFVPFE